MNRQAIRRAAPVMLALLLSACGGGKQVRHAPPPSTSGEDAPRTASRSPSNDGDTRTDFARACAPTRVHDERDYTPGGLYAPGVSDSRPSQPIDVSAVLEPVPRAEPRARYGNRSPYTVLGKTYHVLDGEDAREYRERGVASWYGTKFNGRATSSGELYDICQFTAAHKTLPLPSYVRVTNLDNGRSLIVRVNDRGPFHDRRVMDLSYAAAVRLGVDRTGTAHVALEALGPGEQGERVAASERAPSRAPDPPPSPRAGESVTDATEVLLQLGSFGERDNARRLQERLRDAGVDEVDIDHVELDGRDLWRVRVGPIPAQDLEALRRRLRALELPEPRVVRE